MIELFSYEFMQKALLGAVLISISTGLVGPFLVLRRLSLLGEGLAHLAFGGIALGFLLNVSPLLTALVVVLLGSLVIRKLLRQNIYGDAVIALILSFGVGIGVVIIGVTKGFGVNLFSYLIGSILTLSWMTIGFLGLLLFFVSAFLVVFKRELFLLTFQKDIALLSSKKTAIADYLFSLLIAVVTFMSIQAVGILLVSVLLVVPALIALRLGNSFKGTLVVSVIVSLLVSVLGVFGSFYIDVPPSGFISLLLLAVYGLTFFKK